MFKSVFSHGPQPSIRDGKCWTYGSHVQCFLILEELHIRCSLRQYIHSAWLEAATDPTDTEWKKRKLEFPAFNEFSLASFFLPHNYFSITFTLEHPFSLCYKQGWALNRWSCSCPSSADRNTCILLRQWNSLTIKMRRSLSKYCKW